MDKQKLIIIGGKGSAVVIADQVYDTQLKTGGVEFLGFAFDDEAFYPTINGFPVLGNTYNIYEKYQHFNDVKFIFAMYRPDLIWERIQLRDSYGIPADRWANFIHHSAFVSKSAEMGYGNVILANTVINANVKLGNYNTIQSNVLIGHNTLVGNSNFFAGHCAIGSNDVIENGCFFGLNVSVNNYIKIGSYAFCGMAANVIKSVDENAMVYGNPAHPVERRIKPL